MKKSIKKLLIGVIFIKITIIILVVCRPSHEKSEENDTKEFSQNTTEISDKIPDNK